MEQVVSWLLLPLLLVGISLGVGLLAERLTGVVLRGGLVLPLGFACSLVVVSFPYDLGLGDAWGTTLLVLVAVAGLVLGRARLSRRGADRITALAALAAYVVYLVPTAFSGDPTFAGYTFLGDNSVHFSLVDYVGVHGGVKHALPPSSFQSVTHVLLDSGYPLGLHYLMASLRVLLGGAEIAWIYQAFVSAVIALAVFPGAALLRRAGMPRPWAALGALVAVCAYLPFSYALEGSIKEMAMVVLVLLGTVLAAELTVTRRPVAVAVLLGLVTAAAFRVYSAGGIPWFGLIIGATLAGLLVLRRQGWRPLVRPVGAMLAAFAVGVAPALAQAIQFKGAVSPLLGSQTGGGQLGNLLGPLSFSRAFGTWLVSDFRLPPTNPGWTYGLIGVTAALALFGIVRALRHGDWALLVVLAACLLIWKFLPAGAWIDAKLLVILSPVLLLTAALGVWALHRSAHTAEALVLAAFAAGGVFVSDAIAYHSLYLAPQPRLAELGKIDHRFKGQGPTLLNQFEEYGKHFLRDMRVNAPYDGYTPAPAQIRPPGGPSYAHYYDLDQLVLPFVQQYRTIVMRRSPVASRPPAVYRRVFQGRYYEVWQRPAGTHVTTHLSLGSPMDATGVPKCRQVTGLAAVARRTGGVLAAAERPATPGEPVRRMAHPPLWALAPDKSVVPTSPGRVLGHLTAPAGRYRVWVRGTFGRGVDVYVDGRKTGHASERQDPGQMSMAGETTLTAGSHEVVMIRGGGNLKPGNGTGEAYDAVFLEPVKPEVIRRVEPAAAHTLCGKHFDWIEVLPR